MHRLGARRQGGAAVSAATIEATALVPGDGAGAPLTLVEPLSFWGGLDPASGVIIDRRHPQRHASVAGRTLMMPAGRGSSSGSAALAEAIRCGAGPAAILLLERDPIVAVGALVAAELYGAACPVALVEPKDWDRLAAAAGLAVTADDGRATIRLEG